MHRLALAAFALAAVSCAEAPPPASPAPPSSPSAAPVAAAVLLPVAKNVLPLPSDAPVVVVDREHVLVDGVVVGDVREIAAAGHERKVDGELDALKAKRAAWASAHPDGKYAGVAVLKIDRATNAAVVESVLRTAAFARHTRAAFVVEGGGLFVDTQLPDLPASRPAEPQRVLRVKLVPTEKVVLTWTEGRTVISVVEVPWAEAFERTGDVVRAPGLGRRFAREWTAHTQHRDSLDQMRDQAIVECDGGSLGDLVAVIDALYEPKRGEGPVSSPVFNVTLAAPSLPLPASVDAPKNTKARIELRAASVQGHLPIEVVQRIERTGVDAVRACYHDALAKNPDLGGVIDLRFTITKTGAATQVVAAPSSTLPDPAMRKCVASVFAGFAFPPPESGVVTVAQPIEFTPKPKP